MNDSKKKLPLSSEIHKNCLVDLPSPEPKRIVSTSDKPLSPRRFRVGYREFSSLARGRKTGWGIKLQKREHTGIKEDLRLYYSQ